MTGELDAAVAFYTKLIGWGTTEWDNDMGPYTIWMKGETPVGGAMALPEEARQAGAPPQWLAYISTPDTDATVAQVADLGGEVLMAPMSIPTVGRMAVMKDPQGASFACYTPETTPEVIDPAPDKGDFSWHELMTTDWAAAFDFYSAVFGWEKKDALDMGEMGTYQMYGNSGNDRPLGGMYNKPAEVPVSNWLLYTIVGNVDEAAEQVKALGGTVLSGPMDVPGGSGDRVVQCLDDQGAAFALHSLGR
jgi:predicted enzyme related to lactoylglutathione lyase